MHRDAELELSGQAVVIRRQDAASRLVSTLLAQAQDLAEIIAEDVEAGKLRGEAASRSLARAVEAARKLMPYTQERDTGATVDDLAARAEQLRDATQELLRRTQAIDVTPGDD